MNGKLNVYKASAGSGKTWRLSVEYVKRLLQYPEDGYRHILAVTFTNKAAGEMKERILRYLADLAKENPGETDVLAAVQTELGMDPDTVRQRAQKALKHLLHDYGRFRVSTIDTFFQTVLRNLARELKVGSHFNIDLDSGAVLEKAVDLVYENAGRPTPAAQTDSETSQPPQTESGIPQTPTVSQSLLDWLQRYVSQQVEDGKNRNVTDELKKFGKNIFKEEYQTHRRELRAFFGDDARKAISEYRKALEALKQAEMDKLKAAASGFMALAGRFGMSEEEFIDAFPYKEKSGLGMYMSKLQKGEDVSYGRNVQASFNISPKNPILGRIEAIRPLKPWVEEVESLRVTAFRIKNSVDQATRNLYQVGLLDDFAREVDRLNRQDNRFLLAQTAPLLAGLLGPGDAPFIFEKTGADLKCLMIDEFQDTSHMQWRNFRVLLEECLAQGNECLVVGDEKQSIYRFRNGDWRILGNIDDELRGQTTEIPLDTNYRSEYYIVEFNNRLFAEAVNRLLPLPDSAPTAGTSPAGDAHASASGGKNQKSDGVDYTAVLGEELARELRQKAYGNIRQQCKRAEKRQCGYVRIELVDPEKDVYEEATCQALMEQVERLRAAGVAPSQIAILVRKNKRIPLIASYFASHRRDDSGYYHIVSDEAYRLGASKALRLLMSALRLSVDGRNMPAQEELRSYLGRDAADELCRQLEERRSLPLAELAEWLYVRLDLKRLLGQDAYVFAFMDRLTEFIAKTSADASEFCQWWDEKLSAVTVPMGTQLDGIRILSIHKSKGLEYHTVLLPFCDWNLLGEVHDNFWAVPAKEEPFCRLPVVPVPYTSKWGDTVFDASYRTETQQLLADSLNALYVGITRARKNLIIFTKDTEVEKKGNGGGHGPEDGKRPSAMDKLLRQLMLKLGRQTVNGEPLPETEDPSKLIGQFDLATRVYEYGSLEKEPPASVEMAGSPESSRQPEPSARGPRILPPQEVTYASCPLRAGFRQSGRSENFMRGDDSAEEYSNEFIDRGKRLHYIFSKMVRPDDAPAAVAAAVSEGILPQAQAAETLAWVDEAWQQAEVRSWWSGDFQLYNECSIVCLSPEGELQERRPDRVLVRDGKVQVIDFKFGHRRDGSRQQDAYRRQVQDYMRLMHDMGYAQVEGCLWYVSDRAVEAVTL